MKGLLIGLLVLTSLSSFANCKVRYEMVQPSNMALAESDHINGVNKVLSSKGFEQNDELADFIVKIEFADYIPGMFSRSQAIVSILDLNGNEIDRAGRISSIIGTPGLAKSAAKSLLNCADLNL